MDWKFENLESVTYAVRYIGTCDTIFTAKDDSALSHRITLRKSAYEDAQTYVTVETLRDGETGSRRSSFGLGHDFNDQTRALLQAARKCEHDLNRLTSVGEYMAENYATSILSALICLIGEIDGLDAIAPVLYDWCFTD